MKINLKKINHIFLIFLSLCLLVGFLNIDATFSHFINSYFTFFLIIFLLSLSLLVYEIIVLFYQKKARLFDFDRDHKALVSALSQLSYEEKNVLALFMNNKVQEKSLNPNDQAVAWLQNIKFIHYTGKVEGHKKVFRIEPTLAKYLAQNPNTLY